MSRDDILRSLTEAHILVGDVEIDQHRAEADGSYIVSRSQREVLQRISNQLTDLVVAIEEDA